VCAIQTVLKSKETVLKLFNYCFYTPKVKKCKTKSAQIQGVFKKACKITSV
jgi:hypothetical protein